MCAVSLGMVPNQDVLPVRDHAAKHTGLAEAHHLGCPVDLKTDSYAC